MFCVVVGQIRATGGPINIELSLVDAVAHPVEPHVDSLGAALFDGVVEDAGGIGVINDDGGGWLDVA